MSHVNIFDNQIILKDVEELLLLGMNIDLPVFMLSGPGRGKSSIVKQFADKYFSGKMQTLILSRIESSDLALPIPTKNDDGTYSTHFAISELLPKEPCVLFLDEFSQSSPSCQCIIQQLLLEGSFMHYELPKGTYVVLAGNRTQDNANSGEVLSTIANRCIMCEIKEDEQEFLEYAEEQNLHPVVIDYVRRYPGNLFGLQDEEGHPCFTTPRSMERTSDIMYQYDKGVVSESVLISLQALSFWICAGQSSGGYSFSTQFGARPTWPSGGLWTASRPFCSRVCASWQPAPWSTAGRACGADWCPGRATGGEPPWSARSCGTRS